MRESLPRRASLAIVMALGIIVLTPTNLLADAGTPWVFYTAPMMIYGLLPIILIESFVLKRRVGLAGPRGVWVTGVANVVSALVGIVLQIIFQLALPNGPLSRPPTHSHGAALFIPLLILLIPLFFISWLVEYPVARFILRRQSGPAVISSGPALAGSKPLFASVALDQPVGLLRGMFEANVASYLFLAMIVVLLGAPDSVYVWNHPKPSYEETTAGMLRAINSAEVTYSTTYARGFSPSFSPTLEALGGASGAMPSAGHAGLIDSRLASGETTACRSIYSSEKTEYKFTYKAAPDAEGVIGHYTVVARPQKYRDDRGETWSSYFIDQSGTIRWTTEDRDATATDPPLAG